MAMALIFNRVEGSCENVIVVNISNNFTQYVVRQISVCQTNATNFWDRSVKSFLLVCFSLLSLSLKKGINIVVLMFFSPTYVTWVTS